jgi:hypothetical protein
MTCSFVIRVDTLLGANRAGEGAGGIDSDRRPGAQSSCNVETFDVVNTLTPGGSDASTRCAAGEGAGEGVGSSWSGTHLGDHKGGTFFGQANEFTDPSASFSGVTGGQVTGNGNGSQNADDGHHHHQFDQREAFGQALATAKALEELKLCLGPHGLERSKLDFNANLAEAVTPRSTILDFFPISTIERVSLDATWLSL